jgi:hypothetical protein
MTNQTVKIETQPLIYCGCNKTLFFLLNSILVAADFMLLFGTDYLELFVIIAKFNNISHGD